MAPKSRTDITGLTPTIIHNTRANGFILGNIPFSNKWCNNNGPKHTLNKNNKCKKCENLRVKEAVRLEAVRLEEARLDKEQAEIVFRELLIVTSSEMEQNYHCFVPFKKLEELMGF